MQYLKSSKGTKCLGPTQISNEIFIEANQETKEFLKTW